MSLSAILSPAPSFLQPVPPASMGESAKTSFVAQPQPQPQPQVEGGDVEMSNGVDADADAAEDATPPHKQAIEGRRKSSDAEAGVFVGGREWDADRAMEVDDEHDQQHQHHQQDAEEGEVPSGSVVGERVKGGGRVRFASPAPDAILADVIDVGEETGARHSVSPKVSELPLAPPLTEPIPEPESPSNQHKDGELPLTDSSLPQPPQASASPVILSEPLPPPPEEPPKPPPPPEPPKIRRSMADYIQRKRKQREEEAAKAQASPVVESAALSGAESTASPVVENAPLPGGGEASSASNGGDVEPESSKRSVGENAPPADPSPGDISSAPVQQEQAPSQVQASEPQWSPTSPDTETQSLPYDSGMEDGDGRKDGKDEREYSPSVGNDGSAKSPTPIRDLPTSPLRVPPPERSLERDGRSPSPRPPSRQSSPRQENTTLEAKQEALADDLRLSPRSIYNITTIDLQYIQERSRSEGRTAPQRPPPAESPTPPRRRESTSPTRDRQGEEDGEIPSTTPSLKGTSPSPLLYLARSAYPSRAHTPPTQPRSFHSESGSPPLPYRRPPPPPAQQHFNRPSYSSSQGSQPSSSSRLIPPSGPRALREHQSFGNRGGPHSGSSYIPRGPLADRDRTIDRPDWDRGRPGWQPRGRARGGGGSSWAPR
ncbi:hypothetical protein BD410DRAFT_790086 [Rickenella mellea]|uniref:Uncharacterized protein n=1 Tax=Rickenella mellea TaxID=50990 RepID=A0A4Y7Q0T5_9AGAM|nr:hypothetical protein BD410DRAFT_790086 [Rickenella mellea]